MNLVSGSALPLTISVSGDPPPDLSVTDVTLVLDAAERHVFRWRGTPDDTFEMDGDTLRFSGLTSTFTAENLTAFGTFPLYIIQGESEDTQEAVGIVPLSVSVPPFGPLPVTEA